LILGKKLFYGKDTEGTSGYGGEGMSIETDMKMISKNKSIK